MKLQVRRMQQHPSEGVHFLLAFRLEASNAELERLRAYHLTAWTIGAVDDIYEGVSVTEALEEYQHFDTSSVEDAMAVEEALKNDCTELAAAIVRLPALAAKFDGDDEYEF